jgi:hypothetical protein
MTFKECKGCEYLATPAYFRGVYKGVPQYDYDNDEEFCSCCHPVYNGGVQLAPISECPKKLK